MAESAPKRPRLSDRVSSSRPQFTCQLCSKSYERADHLARHLDSHRDERTFKCTECPRGFNRRDLLLRHQATHSNNSDKTKSSADRSTERAIRACDACVISKLKCGNTRPCKRCQKNNIQCITQTLNRNHPRSEQQDSEVLEGVSGNGLNTPESGTSQPPNIDAVADGHVLAVSNPLPAPETQLFLDAITWPATAFNGNAFDFPSFFEHIMDPALADSTQVAPDFSNVIPDGDWYNENDIFGAEFTPTIDQAIDAISFGFPDSANAESISTPMYASDAVLNNDRYSSVHRESPWLWRPAARQNAFSEDYDLPLDEQTIDTATSPQPGNRPSLPLDDHLSAQKRDKIFHLIIKTAHAHLNIPSFPSTKCLDTLLKVGVAQKAEKDAWFHPYTFSIETARPELLVALVAAGCCCFSVPSIFKTGMVLFEVVHAALSRLFEDDNSVIADLQYLQASLLWLDAFAFCGYIRKMEIAEANLQPLVTALRRAGKFDRVAYPQIDLRADDEGESLRSKWRRWVEQESYKRLVHHVFRHDMYMTTTKVRNPIMSYAEMNLPLPDNTELWFASTAEAWKSLYLRNTQRHATTLRDLLADDELVRCLPATADLCLASKAYVYGFAALTWEHSQQAKLFHNIDSNVNPSAKLWLQSRYHALYGTLRSYEPGVRSKSPSLRILHEFIMMTFHVTAETVTSFAGKYGEEEAHRAYKELQIWGQTKPARLAAWHAAQVLRAAREGRSHRLHGADAFIIHHVVMVLWTYSMLQKDLARKAGTDTPAQFLASCTQDFSEISDDQIVLLDGESSQKTNAFISKNAGLPFLQLDADTAALQRGDRSGLCDLRHPLQVLAAGVRVLNKSFPDGSREVNPLPLDAVMQQQQRMVSKTHSTGPT